MDVASLGIAIDSRSAKAAVGDLDKLTAAGAKTERSMASLSLSAKDIEKSFRTTARGAINEYAAGTNKLAAISRTAASDLGKFAGAARLAQVGVASLGLAAAAALVSTANTIDRFGQMATSTGVGVKALTELAYAARLADLEMSTLQTGLTALTASMEAAANGNREAAGYFRSLGVEVKTADGALRPVEEVLGEIADRFDQFADGTTKSAIAAKLFGESGAKMLPMLNGGSKGLRAAADEAARMGLVFDEKATRAARSFKEDLERLKATAEGLKLAVGAPLLQAITNLVEQFKAGREAAGGFWSAMGRYGLAIGSPETLIARTTAEIARLQAQIAKDEATLAGGRFFGGSGSRSLAERRVEAAREEIKQLERDRDYYRLLARQQIPDAVHSDMAALGGRPQGDTPTRPQARPSGARFAREIEDQITRTRDAVARLISESEIAAAREYALQMQELDRLFFDLGLSADVYDSAMKGLTKTTVTFGQDGSKALQEQADQWLDMLDPMREFTRKIQQVEKVLAAGLITPTQAKAIKDTFAEAGKELSAIDEFALEAARNIQGALGDQLFDIMDGNFKNIGKSFSTMLQRMAAEAMAANLARSLFGDFAKDGKVGGMLGSVIGAMFGSTTANAHGGVYESPSLSRYSGGVYNTPQFFAFAKGAGVFAEAGPEAIMPLKRGRDGKLGVSADGGGVTIKIDSTINAGPGTNVAELSAYIDARDEQLESRIAEGLQRGRYGAIT